MSLLVSSRRLSAAGCLAGALLALLALSAAASDVFTPHNVARIRTVTSIAVAPDGTSIAYLLSVPRRPLVDDDGLAWDELHVVGPDGRSRPFITGQVNMSAIRFTPDGKGISFLARRDKDTTRSLYVMPIDGGEPRKVVGHETDVSSYAWSPDGTRVAFTARDAVAKERRDLEKKGFNQEIYEEAEPFVRVWVDTLNDDSPARRLELTGSASALAWSPAGSQLALALAPTSLIDDEYMARRIHVVDADSGRVVTALDNKGKLGTVTWSPDGRSLAFISGEDINDPAAGRLMVAPAGGGALEDIIPNYMGHVSAIAWRDADTIVYIGDEGTETVVGEVKRDGSGRKPVVAAGGRVMTALDVSRNGGVLGLIGDAPDHPGEVFRVEGGRDPVRLTDSNPWFKTMRFAKQEVVTFKARDGLALEGVLVRPLDERAGQRYPLILTVHGGPEAHDRNGWKTGYSNPGQMAAARGFAVFYPNYRGSTGKGVAFSKTSQGDPAGKEFDDLVDAVDHLVATGLVDKAKVGITGGSYGGYATAWGSTYYSNRFAAGVMFVGISDKLSKVGTTDIANEEFYVHALKRPWDNWQFFLERSPIYHAAKSKTPLLILGGLDDPRVHPSQSMELYRHMKLHGKTVRLVRYPGEQHGNRRSASRLDYSLRLLQWMEHYLKGPGGTMPPYQIDYTEPAATTPTAAADAR